MAGIPLTELIVSVVGENRQILNALKEVEAAKEKALATGDNSGLQRELDKLASVAQQSSRSLEPLVRNTRSLTAEMRNLSVAVKAGIVSVSEGIRQYRALESQLKSQLATLDRNSAGHAELARMMKQAVAEAKSLKGASGVYKTDEIKRYMKALVDIKAARTAGLASERDSLAQLKSLQSQMAQYAGSLPEGSTELRELSKVMAATAQESKRLEAQQDRLEQAFRADALKLYAGELRQIDASVRDIGFDKAAQEVARLTQDLKAQQGQLATNGREFNELGRVLQAAATQQERYQRAAEQAQRANGTAELRTYTT